MRAFVIAMESEAAAIRPALKADDRLFVCGIGKVNAAAATQRAIDAGATEIRNAGVVGALDTRLRIGDVCEICRAVEYDFDLAQLNNTAIGVHNERDTPYFTCPTSGRFPAKTLATGDRFNDSEDDFPLLDGLGCELRDMEGAAIAHVCETNGIPCRMLKAVSDVRGQGGMTGQFKVNLEKGLACLRSAAICWT